MIKLIRLEQTTEGALGIILVNKQIRILTNFYGKDEES